LNTKTRRGQTKRDERDYYVPRDKPGALATA